MGDKFIVGHDFRAHSNSKIPECYPLGDNYTFIQCINTIDGIVPLFIKRNKSFLMQGEEPTVIIAATVSKLIDMSDALNHYLIKLSTNPK